MGPRLRIGLAERRARLARHQLLAPESHVQSPLEVAQAVVALHATDAATVFLSLAARLQNPQVEAIERALYEDRTLIRMLGMRRTMFVVAREIAPVVQAACTDAIAAQQRKLTHQLLSNAEIAADVPGWVREVEEATFRALVARGEATAQELGQEVPALKTQILMSAGKNYAAMQGIATRILMLLSADGRIVRGRPRGSWISSQYRWTPLDRWLKAPLPAWSAHQAHVQLVRGWLRAFGPGTLADLKWWTGLTMRDVKRAVGDIDCVEVDLDDDATGIALADDLAPVSPATAWVSLLPALDLTPMGYIDRAWFLGSHRPALFDRSGNIGPTIWADGRIVGGWAQRADGAIAYRLLEEVGGETARSIDDRAGQLEAWLGLVRITPRFRTPLERELSA